MNKNNNLEYYEVISLLILSCLAILSVYPLLEEWNELLAFKTEGFNHAIKFSDGNAMRPLHLIPTYIMSIIGGGSQISVALYTVLMINARYFIVRWAVGPALNKDARFIVAIIAAVLPGWIGVWLGRFAPAQFVSLLFFIGFGCCVRLMERRSLPFSVALAFCVGVSLAIYQALFLAFLALPIAFFAFDFFKIRQSADQTNNSGYHRLILPIVFGAFGYAVYVGAHLSSNSMGYEGSLIGDSLNLLTFQDIFNRIFTVYKTVYLQNGDLLVLFFSMIYILIYQHNKNKYLIKLFVLSGLAILFLPLLSLTYYVLIFHLRDPDRSTFAVSVFFVVIAYLITREWESYARKPYIAGIIALIILLNTVPTIYQVFTYKNTQASIIKQLLPIVQNNKSKKILLKDNTGSLGDVYTFLGNTISEALAYNGFVSNVTLCTPSGVDRRHIQAWRYPIPSTELCEEIFLSPSGYIVIDVSWGDQGYKLKRIN